MDMFRTQTAAAEIRLSRRKDKGSELQSQGLLPSEQLECVCFPLLTLQPSKGLVDCPKEASTKDRLCSIEDFFFNVGYPLYTKYCY